MSEGCYIRFNEYVKPCCASKPAPQSRTSTPSHVYAALADPTRLRILSLLGEDEICVCHIHASLDVPQPTASRHLAYLRKSGLVEARRDGIWMHYRLAPIDNPVIAAVVKAALHALTHTTISVKDEKRLHVALQGIVITVLFACVHNAGRSQIAAALFNRHADPKKARAISAGTQPATRVHPEVVDAMRTAASICHRQRRRS